MFVDSNFNDILISGRTPSGKRYRKVVKNVNSFFYVPSTKGNYRGLDGTQLARIDCKHNQIKDLLKLHSVTYESDVKLATKYMIENYDEIPEEPIRVCHLDIEVDDMESYPEVELADKQITAFTCYDSFKEKYHSFILMPPGMDLENNVKTKEWNIYFFNTEQEMINTWIRFMQQMDFDVVLAWFGDGFDFPYIFNRMFSMGMNPEVLSPDRKFSAYDNKPTGIAWIDLMVAFRKVSTSEMESFTLDYIAKYVLGRGKLEHEGRVGELWRNDFNKFVKYNRVDVELMVQIEEKRGIIKYYDAVRRLAFCSWYDINFNTRVLDTYFLKKAKEFGIILPRRPPKIESEKIEGAIVIKPEIGLFENIAVGDVQSLYPTAILTCNLSPETIDINGEIVVGDVRFTNKFRGFVPRVVGDIWDLRQSWKKEMRKYPVHSAEYDKWDNLQTAMKFLLNSIYGALLKSGFRLYRREVGAAITYFGRKTNLQMQRIVRENGCNVIYGDTDSVFFNANNNEHAIDVIDNINKSLPDFCIEKFGTAEFCKMYIEVDKMFSRIFFVGNEKKGAVKKRYVGLICAVDGKILDEPYLSVTGFATKRSDCPQFIRDLQKSVLNRILHDEDKEEIVDTIRKVRANIVGGKYTPEEIAVPIGMSKPSEEYDNNAAHIKGIKYYNEHCGGRVKKEKIKYIYVKDVPMGLPKTHVLSFVDRAPPGFKYDYPQMAELLIDRKFESILFSLGLSIKTLQNRTLDAWF